MNADISRILRLEVPIVVQIGEKRMSLGAVLNMVPGTIIELPKNADDELELCVNNKVFGAGEAVKVGENFGLRVTYVGDIAQRVEALSGDDDDEADSSLTDLASVLKGADDDGEQRKSA